jgi:hypothetical protein
VDMGQALMLALAVPARLNVVLAVVRICYRKPGAYGVGLSTGRSTGPWGCVNSPVFKPSSSSYLLAFVLPFYQSRKLAALKLSACWAYAGHNCRGSTCVERYME